MATPGLGAWPYNWRPQPNDFGCIFQSLSTALGFAGPALVGTATTNIYVGIPRSRTFYVSGANMTGAVAAAGSGAITAQLFKNSTALTAAYDLTAATTGNNVDVPITAADADRRVSPGDVLYWAVAAAGTITTTPDLKAVVEASLIQ